MKKIVTLLILFFIHNISSHSTFIDPILKNKVIKLMRLSCCIGSGLYISTKLLSPEWDIKLTFALGIFAAGIASFWYKPPLSKGWQFINNKLLTHPNLQNDQYFHPTPKPFFLTKDQYDYILSILEEVRTIRQPFISNSINVYQQYSQQFQALRATLHEEEGDDDDYDDQKFLSLTEYDFVKYVLPCYSLEMADDEDDALEQRIKDYWRLNDYLHKPTYASLLTQFFIKEKRAILFGDALLFSDQKSTSELGFHMRMKGYGFPTYLTNYRSESDPFYRDDDLAHPLLNDDNSDHI